MPIYNLCFKSKADIVITIVDDEQVEASETFRVTLLRVIGGARLGDLTSVLITIPPNDSPFGRFGFKTLQVGFTLNCRISISTNLQEHITLILTSALVSCPFYGYIKKKFYCYPNLHSGPLCATQLAAR